MLPHVAHGLSSLQSQLPPRRIYEWEVARSDCAPPCVPGMRAFMVHGGGDGAELCGGVEPSAPAQAGAADAGGRGDGLHAAAA